MKKLLTLLVLLVAIVTGAKADNTYSFGYNQAILTTYDPDGTLLESPNYDGSIIDISSTYTSLGDAYVTSTSTKEKCLSIANDASQNYNTYYLEIKSTEDIKSIDLVAAVTGSTSGSSAVAVGWTDTPGATISEYKTFTTPGKGATSGKEITLSFGNGIKYVRIYRKIKLDSATKTTFTGSSATTIPSSASTFGIVFIKVTTATSGPVDPEFTLSANEVEVGKTISVNGPEGLEFTATPVGETTGEVSVSGGTITGVTAGAAQVQVTSSATDKYNAYDHTFDITVIAAKIATELSFGTPTTTVARGEEVTNAATLTAGGSPIEGTITYSSADETIATVDATGKVTGIKTGTTSIKANYAGDATYSAAEEVSYDITVTLPALTPVSDTKWTSASLMTAAGGAKDYTSADVLDNLEIVGTSTALRITTGGNKTIDGETFGGRVRFGKDGSADGNYVHFKVTPNSSITIWGIRATSGAEADGLAISVGAFGENEKVYSFVGGDVESMTYLYTGDADADVYAYSKNTNGASMMEIKVAPIQYETITTDNNVATYVTQNALDFTDLETKAYVVTGISNEKTYVTTEEVTIVPAGTALLVKGATVDVPVIGDAAAPATNLLQISTGEGVQGADNIFAYSKTEQKFKKVDSSIKVPAGKCYLVIEGVTGSSLDIDFNGATAVETIAEANDKANTVAPVKVIKGGQLFIGNYNVAGQQVK